MEINPGPTSLADLLGDGGGTVTVPSFQRNYAWEQQQIDTFLSDLTEAADAPDHRHFYGPIVILKKPQDSERMLVDGQQRISTAVMAIAILRDYLASELEGQTKVTEGFSSYDLRDNVQGFLFKLAPAGTPKFESNYHLKDIFLNWILVPPGYEGRKHLTKGGAGMTERQVRLTKELRAAYLRLKAGIENYLNYGDLETPEPGTPKGEVETRKRRALQLRLALTSGFEIHSMVLHSEPDAFILFETLNDRGMKLSPSDLLKTLIMSEVLKHNGSAQLDAVLTKWDAIGDNIGDVPFSKFLRHYLLTRESKPVQMRRIFGLFKEMMKDDKWGGSTIEHVNVLADASLIYSQLINLQPFARLNDFSETHRVLLLRGFEMAVSDDDKRLLARAAEALAFRWIACGNNAQQLENRYQSWCQNPIRFQSSDGMKSLVAEMVGAMPNDIDFKAALTSMDNEPLAKFLLRRLDEALGNKAAWGENLTLEHLAPQNPNPATSNWLSVITPIFEGDVEITYKRQVTSLGNLALLERGWNSAISNYSWAVKVGSDDERDGYKGFAASGVLQLKPLVNITQWDGSLISKRTEYLAQVGSRLFSSEWVLNGKVSVSPFLVAS